MQPKLRPAHPSPLLLVVLRCRFDVVWNVPTSKDAPATSYTVARYVASAPGLPQAETTVTATSISMTGLTHDETYNVSVAPVNMWGTGNAAWFSVTTPGMRVKKRFQPAKGCFFFVVKPVPAPESYHPPCFASPIPHPPLQRSFQPFRLWCSLVTGWPRRRWARSRRFRSPTSLVRSGFGLGRICRTHTHTPSFPVSCTRMVFTDGLVDRVTLRRSGVLRHFVGGAGWVRRQRRGAVGRNVYCAVCGDGGVYQPQGGQGRHLPAAL